MQLNEKHALQEAEYDVPIHWELPPAEGLKYRCLSRLIASLIASIPDVRQSESVTFIDLGCGDGASTTQVTLALREKGVEVEAFGFDYSERAITLARKRTESVENPPIFSVQPAESLTSIPGNSGPIAVLMREVIEHLTEEQIDSTLGKLQDLCPGFHLIATTPSDNSPVEPKHYRHYNREMLSSALTRNRLTLSRVMGFSFRPRFLFAILSRLKSDLNRRPFLWRLSRPLWSSYPPSWSQTLIALAHYRRSD